MNFQSFSSHADTDGTRVITPHCYCHTAYTARKRPSTQQSATMQRLNAGAFFHTKLTQSLRLPRRKEIPFDAIDQGWPAQREGV